ncbi:glycosyltransferase family 2 protein [[Pseudomonas] carboxydohydrogena]|uniref:Glycosyltransferase family 2 protein n=1 Tax=Afipia carboxydohydrogena TaxID=290 RepID=A0ABY8BLK8_AFICR|nr:glycosyltransferase family A protein [[Pseudomonas] carboxydohydrogena]WEF50872.1 glycosyltransferase family 2 protein [[Pseudomonas] carboxydohydrogena]
MTDKPTFSIVLATYGRGPHIAPTIEAVLRQDFDDFELLVVGDGCKDETEAVVRSFSDRRISWHNLPQNMGSQSFPNNEGIRIAHGEWIAYLGHDDIWTRDHLSRIRAASLHDKDADFAVSGCVYHTPPGTGIYYVHGLFKESDNIAGYFFPPSSIAHRRDVTERIGAWQDPHSIAKPVDHDFTSRALKAGMKFVSTGMITVHKFAAGHRYLSYLRVNSDEQRDMLAALVNGTAPDPAEIAETAMKAGTFMLTDPTDYEKTYKPGVVFETNRQNKGLSRPPLSPLNKRTVIEQTGEARALDWQHFAHKQPEFRWSGPNPRPKILIPYTGQRARITLQALTKNLAGLTMYVEDRRVESRIRKGLFGKSRIRAEIPLKADDYTVLTLDKPTVPLSSLYKGKGDQLVGIAIASIVLDPIF